MHAAALLSVMVTHGLVMPPVERYDMDLQLRAEHPGHVMHYLMNTHRYAIVLKTSGGYLDPEDKSYEPWNDQEAFFKSLLPEKFGWSMMAFSIPPSTTKLGLHIINCGTDERAKEIFLQLRLRRVPDFARSGKFLIRADEETFKWFLKTLGAERYTVRRPFLIW
ncbi:MAG TPA: hypothetical protein VG122_15560 [Gemmata sp.]|jgi:hypothetical protein|nr:hypothetical protein [Gemmata sp.]